VIIKSEEKHENREWTADDDNVQRLAAVFDLHELGRATPRVPGGETSNQLCLSQGHGVSVLEYAINRAWFPPFTVKVLAFASAGYHVGVPLHHLHTRPGQLLDQRMSRHVIRVRMALEKDCSLEVSRFLSHKTSILKGAP
jgi:hypothetical protein